MTVSDAYTGGTSLSNVDQAGIKAVPPKRLRATFVNDTDGRANIGCRLTSQTLKRYLAEGYKSEGIELDIASAPFLFGRNKLQAKQCWATYRTLELTGKTFEHWLQSLAWAEYGPEQCEAALASDIVFFQPEGTLSTGAAFDFIFGFLSLPLLAQMRGKRVICLNGTIPLFKEKHKEALIRHFLKGCTYVAARDAVTAEYYGCDFLPDAAFMYESAVSGAERKYLLITTGARNTEAQDQLLLKAGLEFCEKNKLIPLVLTKNSKRFIDKKQDILKAGGKFLEQETLEKAARMVSSCVLHIGGRYHMTILALTVGVPSVIWSIMTHKNEWLARDFDQIELASSEREIADHAQLLLSAARKNKWALSSDLEKARQVFRDGLHKVVESDVLSGRLELQRILSRANSERARASRSKAGAVPS